METENKLIAEFMGYKIDYKSYSIAAIIGNNKDDLICYLNSNKYHTSWDWLMPVVEKIEMLEGIERVDIFYRNCQITYSNEDNEYLPGGKDFRGIKGETKLQSVYVAVVEFIKWFNTITPNIYYED